MQNENKKEKEGRHKKRKIEKAKTNRRQTDTQKETIKQKTER